jgi:spermidine/putrescine-binding protein
MRIASVSGGSENYRVSRPFAYSGRDRWVISVETPDEPNADQAVAFCNLLGEVIAYARDRSKPSPSFPHTDLKIFPESIPIQ